MHSVRAICICATSVALYYSKLASRIEENKYTITVIDSKVHFELSSKNTLEMKLYFVNYL